MEGPVVVNRFRGYVKEYGTDSIVVQCVHDVDLEWRIPNVWLRLGPGIIAGPGYTLIKGWHGTVLEFDDGLHGFQPDYGGPI